MIYQLRTELSGCDRRYRHQRRGPRRGVSLPSELRQVNSVSQEQYDPPGGATSRLWPCTIHSFLQLSSEIRKDFFTEETKK